MAVASTNEGKKSFVGVVEADRWWK